LRQTLDPIHPNQIHNHNNNLECSVQCAVKLIDPSQSSTFLVIVEVQSFQGHVLHGIREPRALEGVEEPLHRSRSKPQRTHALTVAKLTNHTKATLQRVCWDAENKWVHESGSSEAPQWQRRIHSKFLSSYCNSSIEEMDTDQLIMAKLKSNRVCWIEMSSDNILFWARLRMVPLFFFPILIPQCWIQSNDVGCIPLHYSSYPISEAGKLVYSITVNIRVSNFGFFFEKLYSIRWVHPKAPQIGTVHSYYY